MFGLGGQEILVLLMCGGLPLVAVAVVLLTRSRAVLKDDPPEDF